MANDRWSTGTRPPNILWLLLLMYNVKCKIMFDDKTGFFVVLINVVDWKGKLNFESIDGQMQLSIEKFYLK